MLYLKVRLAGQVRERKRGGEVRKTLEKEAGLILICPSRLPFAGPACLCPRLAWPIRRAKLRWSYCRGANGNGGRAGFQLPREPSAM